MKCLKKALARVAVPHMSRYRPQDFAPRFATKPGGGIDPRPWCQGFYAAMNLNIKCWKRLLDLKNPNHGLLLPILIYC
ncbi:MAG: hypothetical protein EOS36_33495, partial [Mesorhizobium sp.]